MGRARERFEWTVPGPPRGWGLLGLEWIFTLFGREKHTLVPFTRLRVYVVPDRRKIRTYAWGVDVSDGVRSVNTGAEQVTSHHAGWWEDGAFVPCPELSLADALRVERILQRARPHLPMLSPEGEYAARSAGW